MWRQIPWVQHAQDVTIVCVSVLLSSGHSADAFYVVLECSQINSLGSVLKLTPS
jgi:transketolase N-terminal domain/subunit